MNSVGSENAGVDAARHAVGVRTSAAAANTAAAIRVNVACLDGGDDSDYYWLYTQIYLCNMQQQQLLPVGYAATRLRCV